jgi:osmotically-inducible protein OsmY
VVVVTRTDLNGLLLATALGVAVLAGRPTVQAQTPTARSDGASATAPTPAAAAQADEPVRAEVVIRATREADDAVTAKVVERLEDDPLIFANHIDVVTVNGTVYLRGVSEDLSDIHRAVLLARRVAGGRRVVNRIEFIPADDDHD